MTIKELENLIDHEIQWLSYYGLKDDRKKLNIKSDIYKDVKSIGYTKRVIKLVDRCSPGLITSDSEITINSKIEDLYTVTFPIMENRYTPLETYFILFPNKKMDMIQRLIPVDKPWEMYYDPILKK